jgi:hypothetical protein
MVVFCKQSVDLLTENKMDTLPKGNEIIICATCNNHITEPSKQIIMNNSFYHAFANPGGIVFEIGCFSDAKGCIPGSMSSFEFSWFPGYSWEIGVCVNCSTHLGWIFSSTDNHFFGLIFERLIFP